MDLDLLEQGSEQAVKSILAQDVTEYCELMSPKCVLNVLYMATSAGQVEHDACIPYHGPVEFGRHTFGVFQWLLKSKAIAQPRVSLEPRKPRKETQTTSSTSANSAANNAAAAAAAAAAASASPSKRPQTHRNANLSKMSIAYSNSKCIVTVLDECFFDDGKLTIVDRSVTVQPLPADADQQAHEAHAAEVASFLGLSKSRINAHNARPPVLDFTFCDVADLLDVMRKKPASGRAHAFRPVYVPKDDSKAAQLNLPEMQNKNKALIKARNKKGEEEIYEFELDGQKLKDAAQKKEGGNEQEDQLSKLASAMTFKYECEAIRLCNNGVVDVSQIVPVLRNVVANYFLTLHWVDVSNNQITTLCDLSCLPLTTLYLHANRISDWTEIEKWVCNLPMLQSVTLFGNPIATSNTCYKQEALRRLLGVQGKPLRQLDFCALSAQDLHVAGMYDVFHGGKGGVLSKAVEVSKRGGSLSPRRQGADKKTDLTGATISSTPRNTTNVAAGTPRGRQ